MSGMRMRFSKTGRAVYMSHLDLMRTMQRAIFRAGLALKYSEGFSPHAKISIALPLSVGASSLCELMDFELTTPVEPNSAPELLNKALPEGVRVSEVYEAEQKCALIKWLRIEGRFEYQEEDTAELTTRLSGFFSRPELPIMKKTKRGMGTTDIRPAIRELSLEPSEGAVKISALISAQEPTLNPELLAEALRQLSPELAPCFSEFKRIETYNKNMEIFR